MKLFFVKSLILVSTLVVLNVPTFAESQTSGIALPDKAIDMSSLATRLGESLVKKKVPGITKEDVEKALNGSNETAARLAKAFPESVDRKSVEKLYNLALFQHRQSEKLLGLPEGDVYGAMAAFLYGNWSVYNGGKLVKDQYLPTVVKDFRAMAEQTGLDKQFNASSEAEKKLAYEEFAMVGNWMLIMSQTIKQQKNLDEAAKKEQMGKLKELAKGYFSRLGIKPEQFDISDDGHIELSR